MHLASPVNATWAGSRHNYGWFNFETTGEGNGNDLPLISPFPILSIRYCGQWDWSSLLFHFQFRWLESGNDSSCLHLKIYPPPLTANVFSSWNEPRQNNIRTGIGEQRVLFPTDDSGVSLTYFLIFRSLRERRWKFLMVNPFMSTRDLEAFSLCRQIAIISAPPLILRPILTWDRKRR